MRRLTITIESERTALILPACRLAVLLQVLNFHFYCNDDQTSKGASPEECDFEAVMQNLTAWRDIYEPSLQVWLTEFGYDTSAYSPNLAPAYGGFDAEQVQGMWLIRSYMYMALARIDRAQMFMLADVVDNGGTKFQTSGLTSSAKSNYNPKKSWYYVSTMSCLLNSTRIAGELKVTTADARVVRFVQDSDTDSGAVYVAFLGSKTAKTSALTIDISADAKAGYLAVQASVSPNSTNGAQSALAIQSGKVTITVSEMPTFILIGSGLLPARQTGPVPPVDPPAAPQCAGLARGLNCTSSGAFSGGYITCPSGDTDSCDDGDQCVQVSPGVIDCKPNPASECANKSPGLYCDPAAGKPSWPDPYIECPDLKQRYCPTAAPKCSQSGATVKCQ